MILFPAIDLYGGKAVRLLKGEYDRMTVYSGDPASVAADFAACGASHIHIVDLEGAKSGETPNLATVMKIKETSGLFCEIGGGIRSMETAGRYLDSGMDRVILGTAAVEDEGFLREAVAAFGSRVAVGMDIKDGFVAVKGWTEKSALTADAFCEKMQGIGVATLICTDISKDGAMQGTNRQLYRDLSRRYGLDIVASGGVSTLDDVEYLASLGLYGAIIGKAYYTGAIDLAEAVRLCGGAAAGGTEARE
jgi:phosphoribosylformimino-5-aminoimidazole carboxamide ribotide isomerase